MFVDDASKKWWLQFPEAANVKISSRDHPQPPAPPFNPSTIES